MSKLFYLDILRMVSPGDTLKASLFDFYVFGSFDALKVESTPGTLSDTCSLQELHLISKRRRLEVPSHYDKQSMHLYTPNDSAGDIFRTDKEYASKPLVLTLIQLDDYHISKDTPDQLVYEFRTYMDSLLGKEGIGRVQYEVFFCLGEPDIVIAFRNHRLSDIARLIYRIRLWVPFNQGKTPGTNDICVLSSCSHCALPNATSEKQLKRHLEKWIRQEDDIKLYTLFDSSYGLDNNIDHGNQATEKTFLFAEILLGEWDYIYKWNNKSDIANRLADRVFRPLTNFDIDKTGYFRSSYSIPVIGLQKEDLPYAESNRTLSTIQSYDFLKEYTGTKTAFRELSNMINNLTDIYGSTEVTKSLSGVVESMQSTLVGILKHLWQLKDGRFQYDLYAFVLPAFEALPRITRNITSLISQTKTNCLLLGGAARPELQKVGNDTICALLDSYIHDTSRLLTELHHLFSVLSISPHTYLESYGSNMRSITATCKLLVAYQGIAFCLSKHFRMELVVGRKTVQANEVMLVIPYRRIRQSTRVLFEQTSPENRIVYIRINASDMFDVQKTLFMLLHECGHHILNYDFREGRIVHYFKAYEGYLLDYIFSPIYRHPHITIQEPLYSSEDYQRIRVPSPKIHIKHKSEDDIRKGIIDSLSKQDFIKSDLEGYWKREYKKLDRVKTLAEPITLMNDLLLHVKEATCSYIEGVLEELKESKDSEEFCSINQLSEYISWLLKEIIISQFITVLDEEYQKRFDKDDDELWHLSEIRTIYRTYSDERIADGVRLICLDIVEKSYRSVAEELKMIFSDIYSDIFAFSMLRTWTLSNDNKKKEARKYITLLREEAGFKIKEEFDHYYLLVRILAVLQEYFEIPPEEADDIIVDVLSLPDEDSNIIRENLSSARNSIGFEAVRNYTKELCISHIQKQIVDSAELARDTQELFNMYHYAADRQNLDSLINAVFYFWKASTERM